MKMEQLRTSKWAISRYALVGLIGCLATGCFNEPDYSNVPQIDFKGFSKYTLEAGKGVGQQKRDSLIITIGFKDGDGNLGSDMPLNSADTALYNQSGWGNYKIRTFRLENNQYRELPPGESNTLFFPQLAREGKTGAIEGSLDLRQIYPYGTVSTNYRTKFRIQIRDRALNVSNEIETDTITLPFSF